MRERLAMSFSSSIASPISFSSFIAASQWTSMRDSFDRCPLSFHRLAAHASLRICMRASVPPGLRVNQYINGLHVGRCSLNCSAVLCVLLEWREALPLQRELNIHWTWSRNIGNYLTQYNILTQWLLNWGLAFNFGRFFPGVLEAITGSRVGGGG